MSRLLPRESRTGSAALLQQQQQQRRGRFAGGADADALDLFSRNRRSVPVEEDLDNRHLGGPRSGGGAAVESVKRTAGIDDLLSASDIGKHDYDWLLTPPGTPLRTSMEISDHQLIPVAPKSNASSRPSISTTKASRFSMSQTENNQPPKPTRSNSLTRPAVSAYTSHFSNSNKTSVLNTSTASVTSCRPSTPTRPSTPSRSSTPTRRSTTVSNSTSTAISRQVTPASRPVSRPSTPVKTRPALATPCDRPRPSPIPSEKPRSLPASRPSTPTSRPQISSSLSSISISASRPQASTSLNSSSNSVVTRSNSRPSTPTRRTPTPSSAPLAHSSSLGRVPSMNARNPGPPSRSSSPIPRSRPAMQPIVLPDFPLDAPPNLRTKVPERPVSAGRTRPGIALTVRANLNSEPPVATPPPRRQSSSPIGSRGRFPENSPRGRIHGNGQAFTPPETQKISAQDVAFRKPARTVSATESTGFGRTISKKSLDMALRHMDIRQGMGNIRGASLFPQSIRSAASKVHPARKSDSLVYPLVRNGTDIDDIYCNGTISGSGSINDGFSENGDGIGISPDRSFLMARVMAPDMFESTRYDTILLKEDSRNMNWLHSIEDKSDQSSVFDQRLDLPEPFGLT